MPIMSFPSHAVGPFTIIGLPSGGGGGGGASPVPDSNGFTVRTRYSAPLQGQRFAGVSSDSSNNYYGAGMDTVNNHVIFGKFDSTGNTQWQKRHGSVSQVSQPNYTTDTVIDSNGDMVSVGYGRITDDKCFIVKHDPSNGTSTWGTKFGGGQTADYYLMGIAADKSGNTYCVGTTKSQSSSFMEIPIVFKLNNAGSAVWSLKLDTDANAYGNGNTRSGMSIQIDSSGYVIVAGMIEEKYPSTNRAGFVVKIDGSLAGYGGNPNNAILWQKIYNETGNANSDFQDQFYNCAIDQNDDIIVGGSTNYQLGGTTYGIIMKVSGTNGNIIWQRRILEPNYIKRVAVTSTGKIYASTAPVAAGGAAANVLYVYQNNGTLDEEWTITSGAGSGYYVEDIHIDKNDNAILAGYWDSNYGTAGWHNFITKLPANIQRSSQAPSGDWYFNPHTINGGDVAGGLSNASPFTTFTSNYISLFQQGALTGSQYNTTVYSNVGPKIVYGV